MSRLRPLSSASKREFRSVDKEERRERARRVCRSQFRDRYDNSADATGGTKRIEEDRAHLDSRDLGLHHVRDVLGYIVDEGFSVACRHVLLFVALVKLFHVRHIFAQLRQLEAQFVRPCLHSAAQTRNNAYTRVRVKN